MFTGGESTLCRDGGNGYVDGVPSALTVVDQTSKLGSVVHGLLNLSWEPSVNSNGGNAAPCKSRFKRIETQAHRLGSRSV